MTPPRSRSPELTPSQLADVLNFALQIPRFRQIHPVVVASWSPPQKARSFIQHWAEEVLRECGVLRLRAWDKGRRVSLLPPDPVRRFLSQGQQEWLLERERQRRRQAA
jgi:hypothetical protein